MTKAVQKLSLGTLLLVIPALLAIAAWGRFVQGLYVEPLQPVVDETIDGDELSVSLYEQAASLLRETPLDDGDQLAWRGRFEALAAGSDPARLRTARVLTEAALRQSPANIDAWTTLCGLDAAMAADTSPCLGRAFRVGAYDWYTAQRRMMIAAAAWSYLSEDVRDRAVSLVKPMWETDHWPDGSSLHPALFELARSDGGRQMLRAGLMSDAEAFKAFKRALIMDEVRGER